MAKAAEEAAEAGRLQAVKEAAAAKAAEQALREEDKRWAEETRAKGGERENQKEREQERV